MTSKQFSFSKSIRCKTRVLRKDVKFLKKTRVRDDRHSTKIILKKTHDQDKLKYKICKQDGSYKIV